MDYVEEFKCKSIDDPYSREHLCFSYELAEMSAVFDSRAQEKPLDMKMDFEEYDPHHHSWYWLFRPQCIHRVSNCRPYRPVSDGH